MKPAIDNIEKGKIATKVLGKRVHQEIELSHEDVESEDQEDIEDR